VKSERAKLIKKCEVLLREDKFKLFGRKCMFCGKTGQLGLFHIFSVGSHPRLRLCEDNLLIAGWWCCHYKFHHDAYFSRDFIFPKIKKFLGENWEEYLWELDRNAPKLSLARLKEIHKELKEREE